MAFQNNSGDIILDVVLTDEGRRKLAMGGGEFSITKFALGDDEINYELFDLSQTTALQDLSILQTPILEAFTNNTSAMKSKLLSLESQDLLYLPVLRLNTIYDSKSATTTQGNFVVCVNPTTWDDTTENKAIAQDSEGNTRSGMIYGQATNGIGSYIKIDSGIDNSNVSELMAQKMPSEKSFMIEIDNRLGKIIHKDGVTQLDPTSVDDDNIASYLVESSPFVQTPSQEDYQGSDTPLNGPWINTLEFKIRSQDDIVVSNFLFDRLGSRDSTTYFKEDGTTNQEVRLIDTIVRVSGLTTGISIDVPVRFVKSV